MVAFLRRPRTGAGPLRLQCVVGLLRHCRHLSLVEFYNDTMRKGRAGQTPKQVPAHCECCKVSKEPIVVQPSAVDPARVPPHVQGARSTCAIMVSRLAGLLQRSYGKASCSNLSEQSDDVLVPRMLHRPSGKMPLPRDADAPPAYSVTPSEVLISGEKIWSKRRELNICICGTEGE